MQYFSSNKLFLSTKIMETSENVKKDAIWLRGVKIGVLFPSSGHEFNMNDLR